MKHIWCHVMHYGYGDIVNLATAQNCSSNNNHQKNNGSVIFTIQFQHICLEWFVLCELSIHISLAWIIFNSAIVSIFNCHGYFQILDIVLETQKHELAESIISLGLLQHSKYVWKSFTLVQAFSLHPLITLTLKYKTNSFFNKFQIVFRNRLTTLLLNKFLLILVQMAS